MFVASSGLYSFNTHYFFLRPILTVASVLNTEKLVTLIEMAKEMFMILLGIKINYLDKLNLLIYAGKIAKNQNN